MGVYQKTACHPDDGMDPSVASSSLYGVNRFKASYSMFINDCKRRGQTASQNYRDGLAATQSAIRDCMTSADDIHSHVSRFLNHGVGHNPNLGHRVPEVTFGQANPTIPRMDIKSFSEGVVVVPEQQGHHDIRVATHLDFKGHRRYKSQLEIRHAVRPDRYSETCYVKLNSTWTRYVSRLRVKPQIQSPSHSETVYSHPKMASVYYETVLRPSPPNEAKNNLRFTTCLHFQHRSNSPTIPVSSASSFGDNRCHDDCDASYCPQVGLEDTEGGGDTSRRNLGPDAKLKSTTYRVKDPSDAATSKHRTFSIDNG